jgi:hypothetical protein
VETGHEDAIKSIPKKTRNRQKKRQVGPKKPEELSSDADSSLESSPSFKEPAVSNNFDGSKHPSSFIGLEGQEQLYFPADDTNLGFLMDNNIGELLNLLLLNMNILIKV